MLRLLICFLLLSNTYAGRIARGDDKDQGGNISLVNFQNDWKSVEMTLSYSLNDFQSLLPAEVKENLEELNRLLGDPQAKSITATREILHAANENGEIQEADAVTNVARKEITFNINSWRDLNRCDQGTLALHENLHLLGLEGSFEMDLSYEMRKFIKGCDENEFFELLYTSINRGGSGYMSIARNEKLSYEGIKEALCNNDFLVKDSIFVQGGRFCIPEDTRISMRVFFNKPSFNTKPSDFPELMGHARSLARNSAVEDYTEESVSDVPGFNRSRTITWRMRRGVFALTAGLPNASTFRYQLMIDGEIVEDSIVDEATSELVRSATSYKHNLFISQE